MQISDILIPARIACGVEAKSKKSVLEALSRLLVASSPQLTRAEVFDSLIARERLGSTGLGHGVAIPHGRINRGEHAIGAFLRITTGVDFDAIDNLPVDIYFALLVPESATEDHLQILSALAEMFSEASFLSKLRSENSRDKVYEMLTTWSAHQAQRVSP